MIGVAGDWTGSGTTKIGDFSNGTWHLDLNGNGVLDPGETSTSARPATNPSSATGTAMARPDIGVFRTASDSITGEFILDTNGNHVLDAGDETFTFGLATDRIVVGDWNGATARTRSASSVTPSRSIRPTPAMPSFTLDTNNDHHIRRWATQVFVFGLITDGLIVGDWNGAGKIGGWCLPRRHFRAGG